MGWLNRTNFWLFLCLIYNGLGIMFLPNVASVFLRLKFSAATVWGVWASDWLHNLDRIHPPAWYSRSAESIQRARTHAGVPGLDTLEAFYLRHDMVSISAMLTANYFIWSDNLCWVENLSLATGTSVACTFAMLLLGVFAPSPIGFPFLCMKAILGIQFVALYFYLLVCFVSTANATCEWNIVIWFTYLPGILCYALKPLLPKFNHIGPHEIFHVFVVLGHVCSMWFDVANMVRPCAACLA